MHEQGVATRQSPREAFARFQEEVLSNAPDLTPGLYTDNVIVEIPFARLGIPDRVEGLKAFKAMARAGRAALPVRFEEFRNVTIHNTDDPAVVIAEYELAGTVTTTKRLASARFIVILTVDEQGRIAHWREYSDHQAIAEALRPPI